ncbi:MAG: alpha/beta fold hydrolase [Sandaracinaceae bacterium]
MDGTPIVFTCTAGPATTRRTSARSAAPARGRPGRHAPPRVLGSARDGLSAPAPRHSIGYDIYRDDLDAVVDHVDPDRTGVIFIGHSWGGAYAAEYLGRHPERVRAAALLEPRALTEELDDGLPNAGTVDLADEWVNDLVFSEELLTPDDHAVADLQILIAVRDAQTFRRQLAPTPTLRLGAAVIHELIHERFYPEHYNLAPNATAYPGEVLILASDDEGGDLSAPFQMRQLDFFANPTLEVIRGGGHDDLANAQACESVAHILQYFARVGA